MHFGPALRRTRQLAGVSGYALAKYLGLTKHRLYGVETRDPRPFAAERIESIASFLEVDPVPLLHAAAKDRGHAAIPVKDETPRDRLAVLLARAWGSLSEEQVRSIEAIVGRTA